MKIDPDTIKLEHQTLPVIDPATFLLQNDNNLPTSNHIMGSNSIIDSNPSCQIFSNEFNKLYDSKS